jgi:uncharacterized caspase-like protein
MLRTVLAVLFLVTFVALAQADGGRVALVVGISKYEHAASLPNTLNDAKDMSAALKRLGFDVETILDPSRSALEAAIRRYGDRSAGAEASVFHYSGHALEAAGRNWLLPTTANLNTERDLRFEAVDLNAILEQTDAAKVSVVFLDACRDNPFVRRLSAAQRGVSSRGLARIEPTASGLLVAFSTAPGQVALDGTEINSPFTAALLKHIETPGLEIKSLLARVTRDVVDATKGKQRPWQNSSLEGDFYFISPPASTVPAAQSPGNLDALFWDSIKASRNPADFDAYLATFPKGVFAELARNRLVAVQQSPSAPPALSQSVTQGNPAVPAVLAPPALTPRDALLAGLAAHSVPADERESQVKNFEMEAAHKAIALSVDVRHTFRTDRWATSEVAETAALESCQITWGKPCVLAGVDETVLLKSDGLPAPRDMPRTRYAGVFEPGQIPSVRPETLRRADVANYLTAPEPKAAALHPWGPFFVVAGGSDQFTAEKEALDKCNNNSKTKGPCFLYAVGDQVVLPQRSTKPISQVKAAVAAPVVPPTAPAQGPAPASASLHDGLVARLKSLSVLANLIEARTKLYESTANHKVMAVATKAHSTMQSKGGWPTEEEVITRLMETCQVFFDEPCTLAAVDDRVMTSDASPRDMPRVRYAGLFDPAQLPGANDDILRRADINSYRSAPAPKAVAYHAQGQIFILVTGAASQFEAEEQALAKCNADAGQRKLERSCLLYAVGDTVVLPKRLVKPQAQRRVEAVQPPT